MDSVDKGAKMSKEIKEMKFIEMMMKNKSYNEIKNAFNDSIVWGTGFVKLTEGKIEHIPFPKLLNDFDNLDEELKAFLREQYEMMIHRGEI